MPSKKFPQKNNYANQRESQENIAFLADIFASSQTPKILTTRVFLAKKNNLAIYVYIYEFFFNGTIIKNQSDGEFTYV